MVATDSGETARDRIRKYRKFNILSFDGGGSRVVMEAVFLQRIQEQFDRFYRELDLVVGVSTGAVQALGLAAGKTPQDIRDSFTKAAEHILVNAWGLAGTTYSNKELRKVLQLQFEDMQLKDLDKQVAIPTFELAHKIDQDSYIWKLKVFHNFEGNDSDGNQLVVDVAMRATALPGLFPTYQGYCDGAVVVNNPGMVAISQALDPRAGNVLSDQVNLLSLGSGSCSQHLKGKSSGWNLSQWAPVFLPMMLEGSTQMVEFQCSQILRERYHRINPTLSDPIPMDDWKNTSGLIELAEVEDLKDTTEWLKEHWT